VRLCAPEHGLAGEIIGHSLLGNVVRYRIRVSEVELSVDVLNRTVEDLLATGSRVGVQIDLGALREVA
jgi:putative spermidine/putrescine transport system ATP-binding protein